MVACKHSILELLDRISESDIRSISKCDFWKLLTLVVNELDIMSFTVATTLTFSAAYVPGPMKNLVLMNCVTSLTWIFIVCFFLTVFHRVEGSDTIHHQSVSINRKAYFSRSSSAPIKGS